MEEERRTVDVSEGEEEMGRGQGDTGRGLRRVATERWTRSLWLQLLR